MSPIVFEQSNVTFAEFQPEYLPLPACKLKDEQGTVVTCWRLKFFERLKILIYGRIYLQLLTFNKPLQPIKISVENPFYE